MGPPKVMWLGPSQSCNENPGPSISSWSPSLKWRKAPSILSPLCNWLIMKPAPLSLTQLSHNSFVTCHILGTPTNSRVPFVVRPTVAVILHIRKKVKLLPSGRQRADHESKTTAHSPSFLLPSMSPGRCVRGAQGEGEAAPPQGCGPAGSSHRQHAWNETKKSLSSQKFPWKVFPWKFTTLHKSLLMKMFKNLFYGISYLVMQDTELICGHVVLLLSFLGVSHSLGYR